MDIEVKKQMDSKMDAAIDAMKKDFSAVRTGRASLALFDHIMVDYYGTPTRLDQASTLSTPDNRTILISPWEPKIIGDIERAILKSDLGLTPINDGKAIRISIPALTEERRKELVKTVKKRSEDGKVAVRNVRRDINEKLKKMEKDKEISEDDLKKALDEVQKNTDAHIKKIDAILEHKELEIMEV
ncbi:ribosome recycling factor [Nitrospirota bacterium]